MATSPIDLDDGLQSGERSSGVGVMGKCFIDLAIEKQLNELLKVNRSTKSASNSTTSSSYTSTNLMDLDDNGESRLVTTESSSNPTSSSETSTCLLDLDDKGLQSVIAEKSQPIQPNSEINSASAQLISNKVFPIADKRKVVMNNEENSSNRLESLSSELIKNAIVIPKTDPGKSTEIISNPIGLLFECASKYKLKNPCFVREDLDLKTFKIKCSFSGVEGEGVGQSVAIAKKQAAQNCLKNFNTAMLNKQLNDLSQFKKEPKIFIETNKNCKPSNPIGLLYEHAAKSDTGKRPQFESSEENGRVRSYTVTCSYLSFKESSTSTSKQKAKTEAATKVYEKLINEVISN